MLIVVIPVFLMAFLFVWKYRPASRHDVYDPDRGYSSGWTGWSGTFWTSSGSASSRSSTCRESCDAGTDRSATDRAASLQQPYLKGLVLALLLTGVLNSNDYNGGLFILEFDG